jgi:23S rRNA (uracil1939-C5)-methyltransferase
VEGTIENERVKVTGISAGGAGVGRLPDGRAVFVHRTAPGEEVGVRLLDEKRRWARAELVSIQTPSTDRREAPCPHYDRCGGCTLEHLTYPAQLRAKGSIVAEALRRIGNVDIGEPDVMASPLEFRYRNRVSFTLVRLGGGRVVAGFHELNHPNRVIDVSDACLLPEQPIADVWSKLRAAWGPDARRLPSGRRLRLTLRASAGGDVVLVVDGGYGAGDTPGLLAGVPGLASVWHRPRVGGSQLLGGAKQVTEDWQDEELALSGTMFLQVNRAGAALLEEHVLGAAGSVSGLRVVDAYCGVGLHARRLARAGALVTGIEMDPEAVEEARRSVPPEVQILAGRTEELLPQALPADVVILNPPRAGLDADVAAALRGRARQLIYVSCNPATLARDVARMNPDFRVRSVRCFDLFPQTAHVESVVVLDCATT